MVTAWAFEILDEDQVKQILSEDDVRTKKDPCLRCRACGRTVTRTDHRIEVQGQHEHEFANPLGILYRIGCFADAEGCASIGEASEEWTWFAGYAWRIALCRHCKTHLGWSYRSNAGEKFYGLILDRLSTPL